MKFLFLFVLLFSFSSQAAQNVKLEFDLNLSSGFAKKTRFVFMVDNSGSMSQYQQLLENSVAGALTPFINDGLPFDVTILHTDSFETGYVETLDGSRSDILAAVQTTILDAGTNGSADERING